MCWGEPAPPLATTGIFTASLTAANQIAWQEQIEIRRADKYPKITLAELRPCRNRMTVMSQRPFRNYRCRLRW